jgi:hypothetical protein
MEAIQAEYGTISKWAELTDGSTGEVDIKALIFGIREMINEAIDIDNETAEIKSEYLTHKQVGRIVTEIGFAKAGQTMNDLVVESVKDDGEESKNE